MKYSIGVLGLGYVGLPLAHAFVTKYPVVGFDIDPTRIKELNNGHDRTFELSEGELSDYIQYGGKFTSDIEQLSNCNVYIITVPTPVDHFNKPDLSALLSASRLVGKLLDKGDIVIYESTVYPGATEEECVPILEKESDLHYNVDFYCGYSPERINPGDRVHRLSNICKITSGSTPHIGKLIDSLYSSIISAGTHLAPSIKVAEAAKVIENTQRDINIAFVNELAIIFEKIGINTADVLAAAETKWNFLPFKPGLVGGHCIGVDPFYLAHKAQQLGYYPEILLSGRRVNDGMASYIAAQVIKLMTLKAIKILKSKILVLGITFKENCGDIRNSKVVDLVNELKEYGASVEVCDPLADEVEVAKEYGLDLLKLSEINPNKYDGIVLAVAHDEFKSLDITRSSNKIIYDVKATLSDYDKAL